MLLPPDDTDILGEIGCLEEAAVDGLRSWTGSGCRSREADCIVEAIFITEKAGPVDTKL